MPRIMPKRKAPVVDMTAMCDVAFLLLTFFILTAKFKPQAAVAVDVPYSRSNILVDKTIMVTVSKDGKAFFSLKEGKTREETLNQMIEKYGPKYPELATLTQKNKDFFKLIDTWGTPIANMKKVLDLGDGSEYKDYQESMPGVPFDSLHTEIADWVQAARYATGNDFKIGIKADKDANVQVVKEVINRLTEKDIHRFLLITTLSGGEGDQPVAKETKAE